MRRRRVVPTRGVGPERVLARPADGGVVVLGPSAAIVWGALADWTDFAGLLAVLADVYPAIPAAERAVALGEILRTLDEDDLLEHGER